jgi:phage shock protein A
MWFGIASKKELSKELEKISKAFKERDEKIEKLKDKVENNSLKIATLEGAYSLLSIKSQASQVSVSPKSQAVSGKSQVVSGQGLETKLIQRIKQNKKSLIMAEIMKLLPNHTTTETFEIIVIEKNLCSKASFYRYLDSLKSQKLVSKEPKIRLN